MKRMCLIISVLAVTSIHAKEYTTPDASTRTGHPAVSPAAPTDRVIWDNMSGGIIDQAISSQLDSVYPFDSQAADDFLLRAEHPDAGDYFLITDIHWNGTYWNGVGNPNLGFNILIYPDNDNETPPGGPNDPTAQALYEAFVPLAVANETPGPGGTGNFDYSVKLQTPLQVETDALYWIAIQSVMLFAPQWGLQVSNDQRLHEAQIGFPLLGNLYWTPASVVAGFPADMAFRLSGVEPVPASIVAAKSLLTHGAGPGFELPIDLNASNGIDPRRGGARKLVFEMDQDMKAESVLCENVAITCSSGLAPDCASASLLNDRRSISIGLASNLAEGDCCLFSLTGMETEVGTGTVGHYAVRRLDGDMDASGAVTGGDALIIKPHFGEIAGVDLSAPQWDFDLSGGVTGGDFALIKPLFGDTSQPCADPSCAEGGNDVLCGRCCDGEDFSCRCTKLEECQDEDDRFVAGVDCGPKGACCFGLGTCFDDSTEECCERSDSRGHFMGGGSSCDDEDICLQFCEYTVQATDRVEHTCTLEACAQWEGLTLCFNGCPNDGCERSKILRTPCPGGTDEEACTVILRAVAEECIDECADSPPPE